MLTLEAVAKAAHDVATQAGRQALGVQDHAEVTALIAVSSAFSTFAAFVEDHADNLNAPEGNRPGPRE